MREYFAQQRRATGSTSSTSTACGSTRRRASTIARASTSSPRSRSERARGRGGRAIILVAENEPQDVRLVRPVDEGGYGLDALWNDDFHHSAVVALTGRREAYYSDHRGTPQEFISAAKYGYLFQGQRYAWQKQPRGTPHRRHCRRRRSSTSSRTTTRWPTPATARGCTRARRPGRYRAMTALLLLLPGTPMLFQGQEFGASTPVPLLRRPQPGARGGGAEGTRRVPRAVPEPGVAGDAGAAAGAARPGDVRALQAATGTSATRTLTHRRLHADLLALRRDDAAFSAAAAGRASTARCSPPRRSCCGSRRDDPTTSGCWS